MPRRLERYGDVVSLFPSSSLAACFQRVRDGVGIGALPVALAEPWLKPGEVQTLAVDWQPSPLEFTASYVAEPTDLMVKDAAELAQEVAKGIVRQHPD